MSACLVEAFPVVHGDGSRVFAISPGQKDFVQEGAMRRQVLVPFVVGTSIPSRSMLPHSVLPIAGQRTSCTLSTIFIQRATERRGALRGDSVRRFQREFLGHFVPARSHYG